MEWRELERAVHARDERFVRDGYRWRDEDIEQVRDVHASTATDKSDVRHCRDDETTSSDVALTLAFDWAYVFMVAASHSEARGQCAIRMDALRGEESTRN